MPLILYNTDSRVIVKWSFNFSASAHDLFSINFFHRCICWSPKGKQLVTGNNDGTLCQYKPDLTLAKTIPAPMLPEGSSIEALAVYWISTFQFAVVYKSIGDDSRPCMYFK